MLEVTGLPQEWVDGCNSMDEVWVPASFNVETFRDSGVRVPIRVMPLGVDVDYFHPSITGFRPSDRFTFLSVFEWGERKAPEVLLRAFAEEFKRVGGRHAPPVRSSTATRRSTCGGDRRASTCPLGAASW